MADHYSFTKQFQEALLALMARDPQFIADHRDVLDSSYFEYDTVSCIARLVLTHFDVYHKPPDHLMDLVLTYVERLHLDDTRARPLVDLVEQITTVHLVDVRYASNRVKKFGKTQALKKALKETLDLIENDTSDDGSGFELSRSLIEKALSLGKGNEKRGVSVKKMLRQLLDINARKVEDERIPTGLPLLDLQLNGGLGPGELGIIGAAPKRGKSLSLNSLACYPAILGYSVMQFTFELQSLDVLDRNASYLTGVKVSSIQKPKDADHEAWAKALAGMSVDPESLDLEIQYYAPKTVTTATLRSYLTHLHLTSGFYPRLIIVDYADKMLPTTATIRRESTGTYLEMGAVYEDLIALGSDFRAPCWSASQLKLKGAEKSMTEGMVADGTDLADSWRKAADVDVGITINQSMREYAEGVARAYLCLSRRSEGGILYDWIVDRARMRVSESPHQISHDIYFGSGKNEQAANHKKAH